MPPQWKWSSKNSPPPCSKFVSVAFAFSRVCLVMYSVETGSRQSFYVLVHVIYKVLSLMSFCRCFWKSQTHFNHQWLLLVLSCTKYIPWSTWLNIRYLICLDIKLTHCLYCSHILITDSFMFVLREMSSKEGWAFIRSRDHLKDIIKITSKKKRPDIITFTLAREGDSKQRARFIIVDASQQIPKLKEFLITSFGGE